MNRPDGQDLRTDTYPKESAAINEFGSDNADDCYCDRRSELHDSRPKVEILHPLFMIGMSVQGLGGSPFGVMQPFAICAARFDFSSFARPTIFINLTAESGTLPPAPNIARASPTPTKIFLIQCPSFARDVRVAASFFSRDAPSTIASCPVASVTTNGALSAKR